MNEPIPFTKAHACGNDFLIVASEAVAGCDKAELARRWCERNTGIGADGIEFFAWTGDFSGKAELYNADGSEAEISGNGTRCVAAWMASELNSQPGDQLVVETGAGLRVCTIEEFRDPEYGGPATLISTDMDVPEFEERTIELADGTRIEGVFVSMGNPHFVIVLNSPEMDMSRGDEPLDVSERALASLNFSIGDRDWLDLGEEICFHPDFPSQTNVEFVHPLGSRVAPLNTVALRIYERGVGPTASSGTGTSAAGAAIIEFFEGQSPLEVAAPGGIQTVEWAGPGEKLYLTGPATLVARGEVW